MFPFGEMLLSFPFEVLAIILRPLSTLCLALLEAGGYVFHHWAASVAVCIEWLVIVVGFCWWFLVGVVVPCEIFLYVFKRYPWPVTLICAMIFLPDLVAETSQAITDTWLMQYNTEMT
ncbi:hypothetical protein GGR56DRAFT_668826 [Xylariaceae sp. FL0804]|nr:hypothetical protein GGR56DRAFT_668826 [Xylariaceae sp. FL0804]